jgi:hypothetical protein
METKERAEDSHVEDLFAAHIYRIQAYMSYLNLIHLPHIFLANAPAKPDRSPSPMPPNS